MTAKHDGTATDVASMAQAWVAERPKELGRLVVVEGADTGRTFVVDALAPGRVLFGTSPACQLQVSDPTVSRRHAAFEPVGSGVYRLTDLNSTNGTFVQGTRIVEVFVSGGEIVRFGNLVVRLEESANALPRAPLPSAMRFGRTIGASIAMRRLYPLCERIAKTQVPVIIEGETGTGKEVLAESLHEVGGGTGPFVVFDCTTVSPALIEAELFGHERGAFTGANTARPGVFEEADGGTLLIDEIGDLDLPLQSKLLRLIDRGELRRVGSTKTIHVNVRILAATRRDLDKEVAAGRFRDDLFHRLAVGRIELPPLRDRHGDVPLLTRHFSQSMGGSTDIVALINQQFAEYTWPGNLRELKNLVARYVAFGAEADLVVRQNASGSSPSGPDWLAGLLSSGLPFPIARRKALDEFERRYVQDVLERHGGSVARAAKASGLALRYFRMVKARQSR